MRPAITIDLSSKDESSVPTMFYGTDWVPYEGGQLELEVHFDDEGSFTVFVDDFIGYATFSVENINVTGSDSSYTFTFTLGEGIGECFTLNEGDECTMTYSTDGGMHFLMFTHPSFVDAYCLVLDVGE